ncbi:hypothetical protein [Streptomyces sp. NPDC058294]|uniref:hypothetical protein n=1 Tax=Streptomyces sp. NPDC058294 TaxID=3346430 RepID=UPI0036EDDC56
MQRHHRVGARRWAGVEGVVLGAGSEDIVGEVIDPAQRPGQQGPEGLPGDAVSEVLPATPGVGSHPCLLGRAPQRILRKVVGKPGAVGPQHPYAATMALGGTGRQPQGDHVPAVVVQVLASDLRQRAAVAIRSQQEAALAAVDRCKMLLVEIDSSPSGTRPSRPARHR